MMPTVRPATLGVYVNVERSGPLRREPALSGAEARRLATLLTEAADLVDEASGW